MIYYVQDLGDQRVIGVTECTDQGCFTYDFFHKETHATTHQLL